MELALNPEQRKRVLLVEFICDGVPSLRVFHNYLHELFSGVPVVSYLFREKSFGWEASSVRAESAKGHCHHVRHWLDPFLAGALSYHLYNMASCYDCAFARLPRAGDITIGDFWGCPEQWNDKRGVSGALANTPAGLRALEGLESSGRIVLKPTDLATVAKGNPRLVTGVYAMPENRRTFLDGIIAGKSFRYLQSKCFPKPAPKWRAWWSRFCSSDAKLKFLSDTLLRRLHNLANRRV